MLAAVATAYSRRPLASPCAIIPSSPAPEPPDEIAQLRNHLTQRLVLFVSDAALGDLDYVEDGLRVADREEADHVARVILGFDGGQRGVV